MRRSERELLDRFEEERRRWEAERKSLLARIQHPDRVQVDVPEDYGEPEPPKDAAELAQVGEIVPEFIQVGSTNGDDDA